MGSFVIPLSILSWTVVNDACVTFALNQKSQCCGVLGLVSWLRANGNHRPSRHEQDALILLYLYVPRGHATDCYGRRGERRQVISVSAVASV